MSRVFVDGLDISRLLRRVAVSSDVDGLTTITLRLVKGPPARVVARLPEAHVLLVEPSPQHERETAR
jgi:hypothetical protein